MAFRPPNKADAFDADAFTFRPVTLKCDRCRQPWIWTPAAQAAQLARGARMDPPRRCFPCRGGKRGSGSTRQPSAGLAGAYKPRP